MSEATAGGPSSGQEAATVVVWPREQVVDSMEHLCQHAFDVFSQLFSQVDFTVIDGFSYISGGNATFTSLNLLKFGRNYLNGALADEQLQLLFLEMDSDCDGKVTAADWQNYFRSNLVHRANTAAGCASAAVFLRLLLDYKQLALSTESSNDQSQLIKETLQEAFYEAITDSSSPRARTPTAFDRMFMSRQHFVSFFAKVIGSSQAVAPVLVNHRSGGLQTITETPHDDGGGASGALTSEHVFDVFTCVALPLLRHIYIYIFHRYLDANGDALVDKNEWIERLGVLLLDEKEISARQKEEDAGQQKEGGRQPLETSGKWLQQPEHFFMDLMLQFFEHNNIDAQTAFCYFIHHSEKDFDPDAVMTQEVFDRACQEYAAPFPRCLCVILCPGTFRRMSTAYRSACSCGVLSNRARICIQQATLMSLPKARLSWLKPTASLLLKMNTKSSKSPPELLAVSGAAYLNGISLFQLQTLRIAPSRPFPRYPMPSPSA
jgi:hypothetical protein